MGLVTFGFGLLNVPGIVMSIFIGLLLIVVIALPIVWGRIAGDGWHECARNTPSG